MLLPDTERAFAGRERVIATFRGSTRSSPVWGALIFLGVILAIAMATGTGFSFTVLAVIGGVLLVDDVARWVGMRVLGYSDVDLLVFPFFRKAVPAEGSRVEQWRRGVVILLGPLPGLLVVFVLALFSRGVPSPELRQALFVATFVNAVGLIPLSSFDGGRLLNVVLFSRSRWIELGFSLLTVAALVLAAVRWSTVVWGILALLELNTARVRFQIARAAADVRAAFPDLPRKPVKVPEEAVDALFTAADQLANPALRDQLGAAQPGATSLYASRMVQIHERAVQRPPPLLPSNPPARGLRRGRGAGGVDDGDGGAGGQGCGGLSQDPRGAGRPTSNALRRPPRPHPRPGRLRRRGAAEPPRRAAPGGHRRPGGSARAPGARRCRPTTRGAPRQGALQR